jgi:DNA-binding response OmpR family regulator
MFTVLLIEDDRNTARMVSKVLTPYELVVHHAPNGLTGMRLAREIKPDLILVDMDLPDLEGKVVVSQIRGTPEGKNTVIVAFTAENSARAKRLALAFGCDEFISKPIDTRTFPDHLIQLIQNNPTSPTNKGADDAQAHTVR